LSFSGKFIESVDDEEGFWSLECKDNFNEARFLIRYLLANVDFDDFKSVLEQ
jgi:hypothetical protein